MRRIGLIGTEQVVDDPADLIPLVDDTVAMLDAADEASAALVSCSAPRFVPQVAHPVVAAGSVPASVTRDGVVAREPMTSSLRPRIGRLVRPR